MGMIGHEHIGVNGTPVSGGGLLERVEVDQVIAIAEEYRLAVIPALDDMQGLPGHHDPW